MEGLSTFKFTELHKVFDEERSKFEKIIKEHSQGVQGVIELLFKQVCSE
ncbi:hypothetical protein KKHLCK_08145 [Candidatus Electrothrix laxa]